MEEQRREERSGTATPRARGTATARARVVLQLQGRRGATRRVVLHRAPAAGWMGVADRWQRGVSSRGGRGLGDGRKDRSWNTNRNCPAAGHTLVGLVLEASTQTAGVPGTAATWVAPTGMPATRELGFCGRASCGCVGAVCARSPRGPGLYFFWGRAVKKVKKKM
jgi:hypothetical protein